MATHELLTTFNAIASFTSTQRAAYDRYVMLQNQKQLGITTPDDDFHEDVARCYFRAAGIPDELKENVKFMAWWKEREGGGEGKREGRGEQ